MSHLTDVIEEEILRIIGTNDSPEDAWHTSLYEQKRADLTQAMTKAALAVIEEIKKDSEEAVTGLWYVSETTFDTLKNTLTK